MDETIEQVRLLRASLAEGEFEWNGTGFEVERWERLLQSAERVLDDSVGESSSPAQGLNGGAAAASGIEPKRGRQQDGSDGIHDADTQGPMAFALRLSAAPLVRLNVSLPPDAHRSPPRMTLSGSTAKRDELEALQALLQRRTLECEEEGVEYPVFDVYTTLQDHLLDRPLTIAKDDEHGERTESTAPTPAERHDATRSIAMQRVIFWTHHLKAPSKRRDFQIWCPELGIWGIVKLGYPGFLCFEGRADDVDEMVRRVKSLQWHALSLRYEHRYTYEEKGADADEDPTSLDASRGVRTDCEDDPADRNGKTTSGGEELRRAALLDALLAQGHPHAPPPTRPRAGGVSARSSGPATGGKLRTGCEELESVGELVQRLRSAGLAEADVVEALGLRRKVSASS